MMFGEEFEGAKAMNIKDTQARLIAGVNTGHKKPLPQQNFFPYTLT